MVISGMPALDQIFFSIAVCSVGGAMVLVEAVSHWRLQKNTFFANLGSGTKITQRLKLGINGETVKNLLSSDRKGSSCTCVCAARLVMRNSTELDY